MLDSVRLNKQIVEAQQILMVLNGDLNCYKNHPAVTMWAGHEQSLCFYATVMLNEWRDRRKTKEHKSSRTIFRYLDSFLLEDDDGPWWLGEEALHLTHQSRLMHKGNVDMLKTRFGKRNKQKCKYLIFRKCFAPDLPKEWYLLLPEEVTFLNRKLDERGLPAATIENPYKFNIGPEHAYIWPSRVDTFKVKQSGEWREWKRGDNLPLLI